MQTALMVGLIIAAGIGLTAVVVGFSTDMLESITSTSSIEVTQLDVVNFNSITYLVMTVKNTGNIAIADTQVVIHTSNGESDPIKFTTSIDKGHSDNVNTKIEIDGNSISSLSGEEVLVIVNATTIDGSNINFEAIKTRVK